MSVDSATKAATGWLTVVERYPTAWFVVGLALVLLAEGSIRLTLGDAGISLLPPTDALLKAALRIIGFSLALAFAHLYLSSKTKHPRSLLTGFLVVWFLTIGLCVYAYLEPDRNGLKATYWDYDLERQMFTVRLTPAALRTYEGRYLVLVARKVDQQFGIRDDQKVVISAPYSLTQVQRETDFSIDMSSRSGDLALGDWIECQVIVISSRGDIDGAKAVEDLLKKGGREIFSDPPRLVLALQRATVSGLSRIIARMDPADRAKLLDHLKGG